MRMLGGVQIVEMQVFVPHTVAEKREVFEQQPGRGVGGAGSDKPLVGRGGIVIEQEQAGGHVAEQERGGTSLKVLKLGKNAFARCAERYRRSQPMRRWA